MRGLAIVGGVVALLLTPLGAALPADQPAAIARGPRAIRGMVAEVRSVDAAARTITVKRPNGREITLSVAPRAEGALADLKPGERVRIAFRRSEEGLTAVAIRPLSRQPAR